MKRILLISVILLLFTLPGCTQAPDSPGSDTSKNASPVSDFQYEENEQGGITIVNYTGTNPEVVIPAQIDGKPVTQIGFPSFYHNTTVVSVETSDAVTLLADSAFEKCTSLTSVSLPQNLESIGNCTFKDCINLATITLPDNLTNIGRQAFINCTSLKHINIPKGVIEISEDAFSSSGIETISFEEGIEKLGTYAFAVTNIRPVTLPESIKEISDLAFYACANLESVALNEGLTTIKSQAFGGKSKLTEIVIPASVTEMDERVFLECNTLQSVKFEGNAPQNYLLEEEKRKSYETLLPDYTIYYHSPATGFTSPEWCRYPLAIW